jgi:anti-anti-sigma factor
MTVVEVFGEHDLATKDDTAAVFAQLVAENDLVVVDITETQFIDSSFLNNLKNAQHAAQEIGHTVLLQVGTEPIVKRMLEVSNFLAHFDHVSSREEALAWAPAE